MTEQPDEFPAHDEDWREGLLRRVRLLLFVVFLFAGFVIVVAATSQQMRMLGVFTMACTLVLFVILSIRRISLPIRGLVATLMVGLTAIVSYFVGGYLAGPAVAATYALILAALLFGHRLFFGMLAVFALLPIIAIALIGSGLWAGPLPGDFDPTDLITWIRTGLISVVIWGAIGVSVLFVQRTVEGNLERRERELDRWLRWREGESARLALYQVLQAIPQELLDDLQTTRLVDYFRT